MATKVSRYFTYSKKITSALLPVLLCLIAIAPLKASARMGGMDSGGGDPLANEFLEIARAIANAIPPNDNSEYGINRQQFNEEINLVAKSLEGHDPMLVFPKGDALTCFGAPKLGCVVDGKIHIARDGWQKNATDNEKFQVTAMELFMHMASPMRYEKAAVLAEKITPTTVFGATFNPAVDCPNGKECLHGTWGSYDLTIAKAIEVAHGLMDQGTPATSAVEIGFTNRVCLLTHRTGRHGSYIQNIEPLGPQEGQETGDSSRVVVASFGPKWDKNLPMIHFKIDRILSVEENKAYPMAKKLLKDGESLRLRPDLPHHQITIEVLSGVDPDCI